MCRVAQRSPIAIGDRRAECGEVLRTAAEPLLVVLGPSEVAVDGIVEVDADPAGWAKRFYDEEKLIQTGHRYPGNSNISDALTL